MNVSSNTKGTRELESERALGHQSKHKGTTRALSITEGTYGYAYEDKDTRDTRALQSQRTNEYKQK